MMTYILLTPTKNEEQFIEVTIRSVIGQTILPEKWIIVNDDSTDRTTEIIKSYQERFNWIDLRTLQNFRPELKSTGERSAALMNYARSLIDTQTDFIIKIDSDIAFEADFFERIFEEMNKIPRLGICSGRLVQDGKVKIMNDITATRGATRIYRKACFDEIGTYYLSRGEDQLDTYAAQFYGWETRTLDVLFDHLKPEGVRNHSIRNHFETGCYKGKIPYRFLYFFMTQIKHLFRRPFILGSVVQVYGYLLYRYVKRNRPFPGELCDYIRSIQKEYINSLRNILERR